MDKQIVDLIAAEKKRQEEVLEMIPSENYESQAVLEATGSILANKYSEGYPGKRYYQGNRIIDQIEILAIERFKKLFGVHYVNVQPYSGSPANAAVYFALLDPGDKIMGLALSSGGHLTHGHPNITFSGKFYTSVQYAVEENGYINYDKLEKLAEAEKPKIIVCGTTSYPRTLDFKRFSEIAKKVNAYLLADISHIAGLVVAGVHPSPVGYADIIMTTTHKTLRGPRGAVLMADSEEIAKKIDKAVFPGLQGGPHENVIAAMAVAAKEADTAEFKKYGEQVVANAKVLAQTLLDNGIDLVSGGTDNHLMVIDLRQLNKTGKEIAEQLEEAGIVTNKNAVPGDPLPPAITSGIRLGTPAITTRGMKGPEVKLIGGWISGIITGKLTTEGVAKGVKSLCQNFPL
ncbi:serine hydroxymethyltransferase [Patescibacteria group bacterium]|nr:serine hydroxymethyltransferase [Patescibacteria group bacterium]